MNNISLISKVEEIAADIGQPDCKLIAPYIIDDSLELSPWLKDITNSSELMLSSDKILTIAEPTGTLLDKYLELTK